MKTCPVCGGLVKPVKIDDFWQIHCINCPMEFGRSWFPTEERLIEAWEGYEEERKNPSIRVEKEPEIIGGAALEDFSVGDRVRIHIANSNNLNAFGLPKYLESGVLTVVGFTKSKVKCDWDGGKPFSIPPQLLKKI